FVPNHPSGGRLEDPVRPQLLHPPPALAIHKQHQVTEGAGALSQPRRAERRWIPGRPIHACWPVRGDMGIGLMTGGRRRCVDAGIARGLPVIGGGAPLGSRSPPLPGAPGGGLDDRRGGRSSPRWTVRSRALLVHDSPPAGSPPGRAWPAKRPSMTLITGSNRR